MKHNSDKIFQTLHWASRVIGSVALVILGYALSLSFENAVNRNVSFNAAIAAGIVLFFIAVVCYVLWVHFNYEHTDPKLNSLSAMLRSRQQQSEILLQSIADGAIVFDANDKINLFNPAAASLTEWRVDEALGIDIHTVVKLAQVDGKPLANSVDLFKDVLDHQKPISCTQLLIGRNNKQTVVSIVISPVIIPPENKVVGAVAIFRDITKEHQAEQQRADFISTASHEMRTPVAAIEGYLSLALNDKVSTIDSKAREFLIKAHESTEHLGKLFQDLLTSAKAEDGRLSNHPSVVEIGSLIEQLTDSLKFAAQKKKLNVEFVTGTPDIIDASNPLGNTKVVRPLYYTYADPDRLREVITNLFDNAVKYTEEGTISLGLTGNNDLVQFYIRDTGAGIPADDIPHLFQKFYRVDNSVTRTVGGTGLGLFICRKIIELYGGRIWANSTLGSGSVFYINLPRLSTQRAMQVKAAAGELQNP